VLAISHQSKSIARKKRLHSGPFEDRSPEGFIDVVFGRMAPGISVRDIEAAFAGLVMLRMMFVSSRYRFTDL
jgi:hypothetical protein